MNDCLKTKKLVDSNEKAKRLKRLYIKTATKIDELLSIFKREHSDLTFRELYAMIDYISFYKKCSQALMSQSVLNALSEEVLTWLLKCQEPVSFIYNCLMSEISSDITNQRSIIDAINTAYHKNEYFEIVWSSYNKNNSVIDCDLLCEFNTLEEAMHSMPSMVKKTRKKLKKTIEVDRCVAPILEEAIHTMLPMVEKTGKILKETTEVDRYVVSINKMINTDEIPYCVETLTEYDREFKR